MTGGGAWTGYEIGGATGTSAPPSPVGGSATRSPVDDPRADVVPDDDPVPVALAWPAKPRAATAERAAVSASETATVTRVTLETDRIPRSRT